MHIIYAKPITNKQYIYPMFNVIYAIYNIIRIDFVKFCQANT